MQSWRVLAPLLWLLSGFGWFALDASAQIQRLHVQALPESARLQQSTVSSIQVDSKGLVWIATQAGLHRFDGFTLQLLQHDPARPDSLPSNFVSALAEDSRQRLWIGTQSDYLVRMDLATGAITRLGRRGETARNSIHALRYFSGSGLWIGTACGIERFSDDSPVSIEMLHFASDQGIRVHDFAFLDAHVFAATSKGLYRLNALSGEAQRLLEEPVHALAAHRGRLWLGTDRGLLEWHESKAEKLWPFDGAAMPVTAIATDPQKRVWIASPERGLARVDPFNNAVDWLPVLPNVRGALPEVGITRLRMDTTGVLWIGTQQSGALRVATEGNRADLLRDLSDPTSRSNNVRVMFEDPSGLLWLGTESSGLRTFDFTSQRFSDHNQALQAVTGVPDGGALRVLALYDRAPWLWLGTNRGLLALNRETGEASRIDVGVLDGQSLVVRTISGERTIWLGTHAHGVLEHDPSVGSWRQHAAGDGPPEGPILSSFVDDLGHLWVGTMNGIGLYHPESGQWQRFVNEPENPRSLPSNIVRHFVNDADGALWIATHSGVAKMVRDGSNVAFERLDLRAVLPSLTVYALAFRGAELWMSSNSGLVRHDFATGIDQRLDVVDGVQDLEFNGAAVTRLRDGRLAFGGLNGVNLISERQPVEPTPAVAQVLRVRTGSLQRWFGFDQGLQIPWDERDLEIELAALDYRDPPRNEVHWILNGADPEVRTGRGRVLAAYPSLKPGRYQLETWLGQERKNATRLELEIGPPWWFTRSAIVAYATVVVGLLWFGLLAVHARIATRRAYLREIREREQRLLVSLWGSGDDYWDWDITRGVIHRQGTSHLLGRNDDGDVAEHEWTRSVVHPDDLPLVRARADKVLSGEVPEFYSEHRIQGAQGWVWVASRGKVVERDGNGKALRMAGTARNISSLRASQEELRIAGEVIGNMSEAVAVLHSDFRVKSCNPAFVRVTGFERSEIEGQPARFMESPRHSRQEYLAVIDTLRSKGHWRGDFWLRRKAGTDLYAQIEAVRITRDEEGEYFVLVINDMTDRKRAEMELSYLANFDALTGLPNRSQFQGKLAACLRKAARRKHGMALLFIDLDRFKQINDTLGHSAGDELLKASGQRLTSVAGSSAMVSRLGGDEFTVIIPEIGDDAEATRLAQAVICAYAEPFNLGGNEVVVSPSIGIAIYPQHGEDPITLLKHADVAMYSAKEAGRNAYRQYNDAIAHLTRQRVVLEAGLRRALERREFQLVYQPIVCVQTGEVRSVEALLRWHHPDLGTIPPDVFVPILEESGMVVQVGSWVLGEALGQYGVWRDQGLGDFKLAINLSMLQLLRGELEAEILAQLGHYQLPANVLELELTESMVMANPEQSIRMLDSLSSHGIGIVVDDFGTGYSSLAYLKRLPIEKLKIDKSFIRDIGRDTDGGTIVNIVIALAHVLDLVAIAEGVESEEQRNFLASNGCDEMQGFLLTKALPPEELAVWMRRRKPSNALVGQGN